MRLFTFLLSLLSLITLAQDGINYQGVATNGSGVELINLTTALIYDYKNIRCVKD